MLNRLKIAASWFALMIAGMILAHSANLIHMSDFTAELLADCGDFIACLGVPIAVLTPVAAKAMMILSGMVGAVVTAHLAHPMSLATHGWSVFFKFLGVAGIVMGVLGRSALGSHAVTQPPPKA